MQFLIDILVMMLFGYLGAAVRWLFMGFKKPYNEVLNDGKHHSDVLIGVFVLLLLILPFVISNTINHQQSITHP